MSIQPTGIIPDDFAYDPIRQEEFLIRRANEEHLDIKKILTGFLLVCLRGHDRDIFSVAGADFSPDIGIQVKTNIKIRLEWEEKSRFLPPALIETVRQTRETLLALDWSTEEDYLKAMKIWKKGICDPANEITESDEYLDEAVSYYISNQWTNP